MLIDGGLWACLRALPFRDMPHPDAEPPAILVTVGSLEPFHPKPGVYLQGKSDLFRFGLKVLQRLTNGPVNVAAAKDDQYVQSTFNGLISHVYSGPYPAHDPGVLVYHTKSSAVENRTWHIDAQDLLLVAEMLRTGKFPVEQTVAVAGMLAQEKRHVRTRIGVPLNHLTSVVTGETEPRYVVGGIFTGYTGRADSYLGFFEKSLILIPSGDEKGDLLDWMMPGYKKPSYSRAFLSAVNKAEFEMDCNRHGGLRACISCNHCPRVCPVDILPQLTYKALLAGEVEEALAHGFLDCVECGLCSYVCPAKLELTETLQRAKAAFYKEFV
jgi:Na+-transporting NADH:ubiquinone oxidoreductase subunit A